MDILGKSSFRLWKSKPGSIWDLWEMTFWSFSVAGDAESVGGV